MECVVRGGLKLLGLDSDGNSKGDGERSSLPFRLYRNRSEHQRRGSCNKLLAFTLPSTYCITEPARITA